MLILRVKKRPMTGKMLTYNRRRILWLAKSKLMRRKMTGAT